MNGILIQRFTVQPAVTEADLPAIRPQMDRLVGQLAGTASASGSPGLLAGLPSLSCAPVPISEPQPLQSPIVVLVDGNDEIFVNCRWTPASTTIPAACDRMPATLERV